MITVLFAPKILCSLNSDNNPRDQRFDKLNDLNSDFGSEREMGILSIILLSSILEKEYRVDVVNYFGIVNDVRTRADLRKPISVK